MAAIHEVSVDYAEPGREQVASVCVRFGDGCEIRVDAEAGRITVRLGGATQTVALDASGPRSRFQRAVNLISLHMPGTSRA